MKFPSLISDKNHSKLLYFIMFGKIPNLKNPTTMNEYICSTKISDEKLEYAKYTDKYEVRKYVSQTIGDEYLNKVIGIYNSFEEIDFSKYPKKFAMKATHVHHIILLLMILIVLIKKKLSKSLIHG